MHATLLKIQRLQVLEIVVNAPLRRHTRESKAKIIYEEIQTYLQEVVHSEENTHLKSFCPKNQSSRSSF